MAPANATSVTSTMGVGGFFQKELVLSVAYCYVKYLCEVRNPMKN